MADSDHTSPSTYSGELLAHYHDVLHLLKKAGFTDEEIAADIDRRFPSQTDRRLLNEMLPPDERLGQESATN